MTGPNNIPKKYDIFEAFVIIDRENLICRQIKKGSPYKCISSKRYYIEAIDNDGEPRLFEKADFWFKIVER